MKHEQRYVWLDAARGLCAILVCAGHLRAAIFRDLSELAGSNVFHKVFYAITGLGHQSVVVFFVLSGFFVGGSVLKSGRNFHPADYLIARLSRLWVVLIPALVLTLAADLVVGVRAPGVFAGDYFPYWLSGPSPDGSYSRSLTTFLGNVFFVQTILTPVYASNGPLWSLANEFWYYVLFPLLFIASGRTAKFSSIISRVVCALAAVGILYWLPREIQLGFGVWLMGVIVLLICGRMERRKRPILFVLASVALLASLAHSKSASLRHDLPVPSDLLIGLGFSAFCIVIATWPPPRLSRAGKAMTLMSGAVSEISYSLYLSHFPLVLAIAIYAYHGQAVYPDLANFGGYFVALAGLLVFAVGFWFTFEKRTKLVRRVMSRLLNRPGKPQFNPIEAVPQNG